MKCTRCKNQISDGRLSALPNTHTCVNCSGTSRVGCIPVTNHKTGNSIQVVPQHVAEEVYQKSRRCGYGVMRGVRMTGF